MKLRIHTILPAIILLLYCIGLIITLALALALLPFTLVHWLVSRKKWYDCSPSFTMMEKYWKVLAEK